MADSTPVGTPPERPEPDWAVDERTTLLQFLQYHRVTLERQAFGLTDAQAATASASPSMLDDDRPHPPHDRCRAQLVPPVLRRPIHRAAVLQRRRPDGDLEVDAGMSLADTIAAWRAEITVCDQIVSAVTDMGQLASGRSFRGYQPNMRWMLVHMIEEYARHCGHADLIRERIDGAIDL